jgi:hypothetical protein
MVKNMKGKAFADKGYSRNGKDLFHDFKDTTIDQFTKESRMRPLKKIF